MPTHASSCHSFRWLRTFRGVVALLMLFGMVANTALAQPVATPQAGNEQSLIPPESAETPETDDSATGDDGASVDDDNGETVAPDGTPSSDDSAADDASSGEDGVAPDGTEAPVWWFSAEQLTGTCDGLATITYQANQDTAVTITLYERASGEVVQSDALLLTSDAQVWIWQAVVAPDTHSDLIYALAWQDEFGIPQEVRQPAIGCAPPSEEFIAAPTATAVPGTPAQPAVVATESAVPPTATPSILSIDAVASPTVKTAPIESGSVQFTITLPGNDTFPVEHYEICIDGGSCAPIQDATVSLGEQPAGDTFFSIVSSGEEAAPYEQIDRQLISIPEVATLTVDVTLVATSSPINLAASVESDVGGSASEVVTIIDAGGTYCRAAAKTGASRIVLLAKGSQVEKRGAAITGWIPVVCDGQDGWVMNSKSAITAPEPPPPAETVTILASGGTYCRTTPNSGASRIVLLAKGAQVEKRGAAITGWIPVICDGREGWVMNSKSGISAPELPPPAVMVTITAAGGTYCRTAAKTGASRIVLLAKGAQVEKRGAPITGWVPVVCNNSPGWVMNSKVAVAAPPLVEIATVTSAGGTYCRTAAKTGAHRIVLLANGTQVKKRGEAVPGWVPVICAGQNGWVMNSKVRIVSIVPLQGEPAI